MKFTWFARRGWFAPDIFTTIKHEVLLQTVIHWVSTGDKPNPKPNPISFEAPNPKIVDEKSFSNPNPNSKPADIRPETKPLLSLFFLLFLVGITFTGFQKVEVFEPGYDFGSVPIDHSLRLGLALEVLIVDLDVPLALQLPTHLFLHPRQPLLQLVEHPG